MEPVIAVPSAEEVNRELDAKILSILREQAIDYNSIHAESKVPLQKIDLTRVQTKLELAISLWERNVKTLPIFGEPYDTTFKQYCKTPQGHRFYTIDHSHLYIMLTNSKLMLGVVLSYLNTLDMYGKLLEKRLLLQEIFETIRPAIPFPEMIYKIKPILLKLQDYQIIYLALIFDDEKFFPEAELDLLIYETFIRTD